MQRAEERDEVQRLRAEIRRLKSTLADATVDKYVAEAYVKVICEQVGIEDVEAVKQKLATRLPTAPSKKVKARSS